MEELCTQYRIELSAFIDGQLEKALMASVEEHLNGCDNCATELTTMKALSKMLNDDLKSPNLEVPDLWDAIKSEMPSVCEVMQEDLSAYLDGELPPAAQEGVNNHLKECENCLGTFKAMNATNQVISKGLELPADIKVDLWPAVKSRLNEDCALIHTELSPYIDQEVATLRHRAITAHLVDCQGCRDEFDRLSSVGETIREFYKPEMAEDFDLWPAIKSELQVVPFTPRTKAKPKQSMRRAYWMTAAAAVILGLVGVGGLFLMSSSDSQVRTVSAEDYLIDSAFSEPSGTAEAVLYEDR